MFNTRSGKTVKISRLVKLHSDELQDVNEVFAGDIFATFGIDCATGDTFTKGAKDLTMESMHVPDPVMSFSIRPAKDKTEKVFQDALVRFSKEDPSFTYYFDNEAGEFQINGMGELHLEIYAQRMEREYNCPVILGQPKVQFRETILNEVEFDFEHKRQSGGRGQYGRAWGCARPLDDFTAENFNDLVTGTDLPRNFIKPLIQGMKNSMAKGTQIGAPVAGIEVDIINGKHHQVDSSEIAFLVTGEGCMDQVLKGAEKSILEPIMNVEVTFPNEFEQRVNMLLLDRHVEVESTETDFLYKTVHGFCPLNDMFGFTGALRGVTEGKGEYSMEFSHYDHCRDDTAVSLIADYQAKLATPSDKKGKKKK